MKSENVFRVLAFGDIVGDPGRRALFHILQEYKIKWDPDLVVVNGENAAHGFGITKKLAEMMFNRGVDVITGGNHIWHRKEIFNFIDEFEHLLRPLNYPPGTPGKGVTVIESGGVKAAVLNSMGRIYMEPIDCPFQAVEKEILRLKSEGIKIILVDFHAEASSEKQVFARYFDGKVSAIWGTHTHVQTADETILPGKTAYITDIGMCGCVNSIIGMKIQDSYRKVIHHLPVRFSPETEGNLLINGVMIDIDKSSGQSVLISRIKEELKNLDVKNEKK